ncbi:hypothetical protein MOUN0_I03290 [Monosporozyma unispora]
MQDLTVKYNSILQESKIFLDNTGRIFFLFFKANYYFFSLTIYYQIILLSIDVIIVQLAIYKYLLSPPFTPLNCPFLIFLHFDV